VVEQELAYPDFPVFGSLVFGLWSLVARLDSLFVRLDSLAPRL